jgi:hypothetical protein
MRQQESSAVPGLGRVEGPGLGQETKRPAPLMAGHNYLIDGDAITAFQLECHTFYSPLLRWSAQGKGYPFAGRGGSLFSEGS